MRHPIPYLAAAAALACHPGARHRAGQALAPDSAVEPMVACVRTALEDSPNVAKVGFKSESPRTQYITFVNPPGVLLGGMTLIVAPSRGTPSQLVVEYTLWRETQGKPGIPTLTDLNAPAVSEAGARLLRDVRDQCAPTAPGAAECSTMPDIGGNENHARSGRCSIGI
jgi:hypothetical protein